MTRRLTESDIQKRLDEKYQGLILLKPGSWITSKNKAIFIDTGYNEEFYAYVKDLFRRKSLGHPRRKADNISFLKKGKPAIASRLNNPTDGSWNRLYRNYSNNAKRRSFEFEITLSEFKIICSKNCNYCNIDPLARYSPYINNINGLYSEKDLRKRGSIYAYALTTIIYYNGIDRIDNNRGYLLDNCVACCEMCNRAKLTHSRQNFLDWVKKVYDFNLES